MYFEKEPTARRNEAWQLENSALKEKSEGNGFMGEYYETEARRLRKEEIRTRIQALFEYSDAQNELLDGIASIHERGEEISIVEFPGELSGSLKGTGE